MKLILASTSAARTAMLTAAGVAHEAVAPDVDERGVEDALHDIAPATLASTLAQKKALAVEAGHGMLVLGSDQVLETEDGDTLSKPADVGDARAQLMRLRGNRHRLISAAAIAERGDIVWRGSETATLHMRDFSDAFLDDYLAREWDGAHLCRRLPGRRPRSPAFRAHRRQPLRYPRAAASPGSRLSPRAGSGGKVTAASGVIRPFAEVIGDPVAHSKSPSMHGFWLDQLGIDADYRAHRVVAGELGAYLRARRHDPAWRGCNVTSPHKAAVIEHLSALGPDARSIGAVNTIVPQGEGELLGLNTDAHGVLFTLADVEAQHAVVIGAGGAARAALFALKVMAVPRVTVINRDMIRARRALDDLEVDGRVLPEGTSVAADLLVNATPMGMAGQPPLAFDIAVLQPSACVFDMVTAPAETDLLGAARARGLRTFDGLTMLAEQGAMAFAAFFNAGPAEADTPVLRAVLEA